MVRAPRQVLYTSVCKAFGDRGLYEDAFAVFHEMSTGGVPLDSLVFTYMISLAGKVRSCEAGPPTGRPIGDDATMRRADRPTVRPRAPTDLSCCTGTVVRWGGLSARLRCTRTCLHGGSCHSSRRTRCSCTPVAAAKVRGLARRICAPQRAGGPSRNDGSEQTAKKRLRWHCWLCAATRARARVGTRGQPLPSSLQQQHARVPQTPFAVRWSCFP